MDTSINLSIKLMIFLWRSGVVDSFTAIQFMLNGAIQYGQSLLNVDLVQMLVTFQNQI